MLRPLLIAILSPLLRASLPLCLGASFFLGASPAPAQQRAQETALDPAVALKDLRAACREAPIAERVRVAVRTEGRPTWREEFILRLDAGKPGLRPPRLLLELGDLRIAADADRLVAISTRNQRAYFTADLPDGLSAAALSRAIPPVPIPQLAFALADDPAALRDADLTPYTPAVAWDSAVSRRIRGGDVVTITGRGEHAPAAHQVGRVTAVIHARTGRLLRFEAELDDARVLLTLEFERLPPSDPARWTISTEGREPVASLAALTPARGDIRPGDPFPDMLLSGPAMDAWEPARLVPADADKTALVALLFALDQAPDGEPDVRLIPAAAAAERAATQAADPEASPRILAFRRVIIFPGPLVREKLAAASQAWGRDFLWTISRQATLDRFAPGADAALVLVSTGDRTVRAVIRLGPPDADTPDAILARLRTALAPQPPTAPPDK